MFSDLSVILFPGAVSDRHPQDLADSPPDQANTPWTRQTPTDQADTPPLTRQTPLPADEADIPHPPPESLRADPLHQADTPFPRRRQPLQRTVRILLECIFVKMFIF